MALLSALTDTTALMSQFLPTSTTVEGALALFLSLSHISLMQAQLARLLARA